MPSYYQLHAIFMLPYEVYAISIIQSDTKNGNYGKTQQKLKKSKKKKLLTEIEPLQLAF